MRVAVVAGADPLNVLTWSGTPFHMTRTLQREFPDLLSVRFPRPAWIQKLRRATKGATYGRIDIYWSRSLARWNGKGLGERLKGEDVDVAVCIGNAPLSAFLA